MFVDGYTQPGEITCGNATQSAIRAGYASRCAGATAHNLLKKTEIKEAIEAKIAELRANNEVTLYKLRERLWKNERKAQEKGDLVSSNKALELLGKTIGAYIDKHESRHSFAGFRPDDAQADDAQAAIERSKQRQLLNVTETGRLEGKSPGKAVQNISETDNQASETEIEAPVLGQKEGFELEQAANRPPATQAGSQE